MEFKEVYSSISDNWERLKIMHKIAYELYMKNEKTDDSERYILFGVCIVWSVITLEALVNEALAYKINNDILITKAIEHPKQIIQKFKNVYQKGLMSEITCKLIILSGRISKSNEDPLKKIIDLGYNLANKRNAIVHDKPLATVEEYDGEKEEMVEIDVEYGLRNMEVQTVYDYEDLIDIYKDCDRIRLFIDEIIDGYRDGIETYDLNFCSLFDSD